MKDLSVIIVSYKGWERLEKCLDSLNFFNGAAYSFEVIVVDNSADEKIRAVEKEYPGFKFICNAVNGGFSNGCNLGAKNSSGKFLLFLNPDTIVTEGEIGKLLKVSEQNHDYFITSCNQVNEKGDESKATGQFPGIWNLTGLQRSLVKLFKTKKEEVNDEILFPDWVSGSVIMIRKEIFRMINGFDEDFWMYYEDVDICRRVREAHGEIAFFRNITVEHNHGGSTRINHKVTSITKTEVLISKHLYISKSKSGAESCIIQLFLVLNNLVSGILPAIAGALLFYIPEMFVRTLIFLRLVVYYAGAVRRRSWVSPRSVNSVKTKN